jgi:N-acetylglutamate synthase-like GNAT family acetyltransferase
MDIVDIRIRKALPQDVPELRRLIETSVRELQAQDYTPAQMEGALESVFGVDSQLIADGSYLVAEARIADAGSDADSANISAGKRPGSEWAIAGCGGWSKRKTLYGGDCWTAREDSLLDPKRDAAKIRAFFIHPAWARRGVGSKILEACELAAREAGFTRFEMGATLTGAKLFGAKGYVAVEKIEVPLKNGLSLPVIHMAKQA